MLYYWWVIKYKLINYLNCSQFYDIIKNSFKNIIITFGVNWSDTLVDLICKETLFGGSSLSSSLEFSFEWIMLALLVWTCNLIRYDIEIFM